MKRAFDPQEALRELVRVGSSDRFDIRIDYGGEWYYQGSRIERIELVRLFSTALHRAPDDSYWLITPYERGRIEVADTPFVITGADAGEVYAFEDNIGRKHLLGDNAEFILTDRDDGRGAVPYLRLGGNIEARILSSVYYELVEMAIERDGRMGLKNGSTFIDLGACV